MGRTAFAGSVLGAVLLLGACGEDTQLAEAEQVAESVAPTTAPTTTSAEQPSELPPCAGDRYIAAPDWLPGTVPPGFEITSASVYVETPLEAPEGSGASFLFVERKDDLLASSIGLVRDPPEQGFDETAPATGEPTLDTVRRRPGTVARMVHRADPHGASVAKWEESGHRWTASSRTLDLHDLAAALEPFDLSTDTASDPTRRFELIGRQPPRSTEQLSVERRTTNIVLSPIGEDPAWRTAHLFLTIDAPLDGAEGLSALPVHSGEMTLSEADGRLFVHDTSSAITTLADGSVARAEFRIVRPERAPVGPDPDAVRGTLLALAPVAPDDPALDGIVLSEGENELFCREDR